MALLLCATAAFGSARADAKLRKASPPLELNVLGPTRPLTQKAWLGERLGKDRRFDLEGEGGLRLLARYREPGRNREPEWRSFWHGRYGLDNLELHPKLSWGKSETESRAFDLELAPLSASLALRAPELVPVDVPYAEVLPDWSLSMSAPEPESLGLRPRKLCPKWKRPRAVSIVRYDGAEFARLPLVDCAGGIAPDALDRLSVLARPPATPKPALPLPLEPDDEAADGEWLPRVKLVHPRLIWAVQQIAAAFPERSIFIMSGYRRDSHGYHQQGRALDLYVTGVNNADLFRVCRTLSDVGCGFYPNNKFVHVDVRPFGSHRVAWVDVSQPGKPSEYVSSWPGVLGAELRTSGVAE